jgi:alanyl-tRNA synthetase
MLTAKEPVLRSLGTGELRKKYLEFFKSKGHAIIPSASLIPENDPTTLFTGSGMQPMISYLLGEKHPLGTRLADSQKCFRSQDVEEVGDNRHTTFFEMLGNWSLGDYFKAEQITWMFEFLTDELKLNPANLYVSVFRGLEDKGLARDDEAAQIWQQRFSEAGIEAKIVDQAEMKGLQDGRIFYYGEKQNWWSRSGVTDNMPIGEPGGPDSEIYWDFGAELKIHENSEYKNQLCHPACDCGRFLEIGNNVFMQYIKTEDGFKPLPKKNIDFGGGLERLLAAAIDTPDIFKTSAFASIIEKIEEISGKKYEGNERAFRIIADHLKAATMILGDEKGITPSNVGPGYVLRRLIRRAVRYGKMIGINNVFTFKLAKTAVEIYKDVYPEVKKNQDFIINQLIAEEEKFKEKIEEGEKLFNKWYKLDIFWEDKKTSSTKKIIPGKYAFDLYQTYGFPIELTNEMANEKGLIIDMKGFTEELQKHQKLSRTASAGMFKGGLADSGEMSVKYHTATHLLLAALRETLGQDLPAGQAGIYQKGSNITAERLRFDFNYPQKLTEEQIKKVEDLVNQKIQEKIPVEMIEMPKSEALKIAKVSFDPAKYGEVVKVYKIGNFSIELCGGPHVKNTGELGHFKIQKEESSSAGVRRIKAVLE